MARNLYITAMEPQSGKSAVLLGLMELLSGRVERLGFFRPIVLSGTEPDPEIELIRRRYRLDAPYAQMHALTEDEASWIGKYEDLRKRVVEAYKRLEQDCDFVQRPGLRRGLVTPASRTRSRRRFRERLIIESPFGLAYNASFQGTRVVGSFQ